MNLDALLRDVNTLAVVCNQFGDSGKGKIVDFIAYSWADIVIRGTGGGNAGHTVNDGDLTIILHTVPCGILNPDVLNIDGPGVAVDPRGVCKELDELDSLGIEYKFRISRNARLILPQHLVLDRMGEKKSGKGKIGTTGRGIGPCYTDHYARIGLVVNDLLNRDVLARKLQKNLRDKLVLLEAEGRETARAIMQHEHLDFGIYFDQKNIFDVDAVVEMYTEYGKRLKSFIADTDEIVRKALGSRKRILLEGAQGHGLSIDYGTYPFVTSSDCDIPGLAKGAGLKERDVDFVLGVVKCPYMTRVGEGPFPTELGGEKSAVWCDTHKKEDEDKLEVSVNDADEFNQGIAIRKVGEEYGATTGRPRRTGWLDLPFLRNAMQVNGTNLALTKLQVFDGVSEIKICTHYIYQGNDYEDGSRTLRRGDLLQVASQDLDIISNCQPVYTTLRGWKGPTQDIKDYNKLPRNLKRLVEYVKRETGGRVRILSMGPKRTQTILR